MQWIATNPEPPVTRTQSSVMERVYTIDRMFVLLWRGYEGPKLFSNFQQERSGELLRLAGKPAHTVQRQFLNDLGWPIVQHASFGLAGEEAGIALDSLGLLFALHGAGETSVLVLLIKPHLSLVFPIKIVGIQ